MSNAPGLTDADRRKLAHMAEYGPPGAPEARAKGGRKRWEGRCTACDAELEANGTCAFCADDLDPHGDFEDGEDAAEEFLHRCRAHPND